MHCLANPGFRGLLIRVTLVYFCMNSFWCLFPIFARSVLHMGSAGFGLLMGAVGGGAVIAADIPMYDLAKIDSAGGYHYSDSRGVASLRGRIADYYLAQYGVRANPDTEVLVSIGSKMCIYLALMALLEPGDEVLVQEPHWLSYPAQEWGTATGTPPASRTWAGRAGRSVADRHAISRGTFPGPQRHVATCPPVARAETGPD